MLAANTFPAEWVHRIESEYLEMPGLSLTRDQAQKLWGLDSMTCERILSELIDIGFLKRTSRGTYVTTHNEFG